MVRFQSDPGPAACHARSDGDLRCSRADSRAADRGPEGISESDLLRGSAAHHHRRRGPVRQPRSAAGVLQTLLGYPALQAGVAMTPRGLGSFLTMRTAGRESRSPQATRRRHRRRFAHAVRPLPAQLERGILGYLLAAVLSGHRAGATICAVDHGDDGLHPPRGDGQRHKSLQLHAEHRRQLRNRAVDHHAGARPAIRTAAAWENA